MGEKVTIIKVEYNYINLYTEDKVQKIIDSADVTFNMGRLEGTLNISTSRYLELKDILYELMRYLKINTNGEECHEIWR